MESTKKNTLVFEFPKDAPGPTLIDMNRFVKNFGANRGEMDTCYRNADEKCIFIRFKTAEAFNEAIVDNPEVHTFQYSDGKTVPVKMSVAGGVYRYIRLFNLPPEVDDADISRVMTKYGKVKKLIREKFPPECELELYTGIRGAYVDVQMPIPAALYIRNSKARVYYEGLKNRCFHCKAEDHLKAKCPLMAESKMDEKSTRDPIKQNSVSFAEALSSPKSVLAARLETIRSSIDADKSKERETEKQNATTSEAGCSNASETTGLVEGDSASDDTEKGKNGEKMVVNDKGMGTKRVLTGVTSQSDSDGSNADSTVQRSVPKKQRNEAIQNIPKDETKKDQDRPITQTKRNGGKGKRGGKQ